MPAWLRRPKKSAQLFCSPADLSVATVSPTVNHLLLNAPIGTVLIRWTDAGLISGIEWLGEVQAPGKKRHPAPVRSIDCTTLADTEIPPIPTTVCARLRRYFQCGEPLGRIEWSTFDQGEWTDFQRKVYRTLEDIPHGETRTYAWVARRIGQPMATRAVGQALRRNPIPLLIPCHRVVGETAMGGFMGKSELGDPEMELKKTLLDLERSYTNPPFSFMDGHRPMVAASVRTG